METLLNEKEAAVFLGIDEVKLKGLVKNKLVPAYMIAGEFIRFKKAELETLKDMLGKNIRLEDDRIFNKAFSEVRGFERFKEILRANDMYLVTGILVFMALIAMVFKFYK